MAPRARNCRPVHLACSWRAATGIISHLHLADPRQTDLQMAHRLTSPIGMWQRSRLIRSCKRSTVARRDSIARSLAAPDPHSSEIVQHFHSDICFGDPGRVRTCNLPLRRGLLYPVEPRGRFACALSHLVRGCHALQGPQCLPLAPKSR